MNKKINIIGNIFGTDGYSSHCRQLANSLHERGFDVRIDCQKPQNWQLNVTDSELLMLEKQFDEDMTTIFIGQPPYWRIALADNPKNFIGFLVWEGDKVPEYWLEYLLDERVNQIWVPSEYVKKAIINTLNFEKQPEQDFNIQKKIKVIPHGINQNLFYPRNLKKQNIFTFICNKGWRGGMTDRGGVQFLLKAFTEEFTNEDDVQLILKLNPAYLPYDFDFKTELEKIGAIKTDKTPKILFNSGLYEFNKMPEFYQDGDVFVCPTRAEGFNLPGLEAKAMGLPTIQTNFGGQTDYMKKDTDYFIDYTLEYVTDDILYEGIQWATPDIKHLKKLMREAYNNKEQIKNNTDKCFEQAKEFTWSKTVEKINEVLKELD